MRLANVTVGRDDDFPSQIHVGRFPAKKKNAAGYDDVAVVGRWMDGLM